MGEFWSLAGTLFSRFRSAASSPTVALSGALPTPTCRFPLHNKQSGQASPLCDPRAPPSRSCLVKSLRVVSHPDLSGGPWEATPRAQRGRTGPCRWGELRPGNYLERAGASAGHQSRRRRSSSSKLLTRVNSVPPGRILSHGSPRRQSCRGEAQPGRHRLAAPVTAAAAAATAAAATHTPSVQRRWRGPALWGLPGAQPATVLPGTSPRKQRPGSPASSKPAPGRRSWRTASG